MVALACTAAALGLLAFNSGLAKVTPQEVGAFFALMIVVQITVPALHHIIETGEISVTKLSGFVVAGIAAYLLS